YINAEQFFGGVPETVWHYQIGGYQVAHKWLKDRIGRLLTFEELDHFRRMFAALDETLRLQQQIDRSIPAWPLEYIMDSGDGQVEIRMREGAVPPPARRLTGNLAVREMRRVSGRRN